MAQDILTLFVYLFGIVLVVTIINVSIVLLQVIEDIPWIRKRVWKFTVHGFRNTHNTHN